MNLLDIINFIFLTVASSVFDEKQKCFNNIKILAENDKCLSSRRQIKVDTANLVKTPEEFFLKVSRSKCDGTAFACGLTTSYVTEIFQGLQNQYSEYKNEDNLNGEKAGYKLLIGDKLRNLFISNKDSKVSIAYSLRHIGPEDHVWTIEQLANGGGYRIYQSYFQAYSLKAWLSDKTSGLYKTDNSGDIMVFNGLKDQISNMIKSLTGGMYDLRNYEGSSVIPENIKPFIKFVKDYNSTTARANFEKAWNKYGKGKLISWNEMENYINILANMTSYFDTNQNTIKPFDEKIYNQWIELFGSPNPVHYKNLANNFITNMLFNPKRTYRFEVKTINFKPMDCAKNIHNILV